PCYALACRARRDAAGRHGARRAAGFGDGKPLLAWTYDPCTRGNGRAMKGTQFAQFSAEVLRRGAAAVLPQHLSDRWLDALLGEADLLAPEEEDSEEGSGVRDCCAGLLGAVLVVLMEQRGHPNQLDVAVSTLMRYLYCYALALAAERVSRDTDIWLEPPTLANLFDEEREVRGRR